MLQVFKNININVILYLLEQVELFEAILHTSRYEYIHMSKLVKQ